MIRSAANKASRRALMSSSATPIQVQQHYRLNAAHPNGTIQRGLASCQYHARTVSASPSTSASSVTAAATGQSTYSQNHYSQQGASWSSANASQSNMLLGLGMLASATAAATSLSEDHSLFSKMRSSAVTRCDDDKSTTAEQEESEDPYDNLPEKDEPTHCSICMTYRQGPCRPYWRKVEACTKDNELPEKKEGDEEDGGGDNPDSDDDPNRGPDPPCLKYMMPWIDCASGYRNLYVLIEMDTNYTEGIADLEATATQEFCWAPQWEPTVDWSAWQDYVELLNPEWKLPRATSKDKKQHFWKSLDHSKDPELVQVEAQVPTTMGEGILECAYALDQNGDVIGFAYGTKPSDAAAAKEKGDGENEKQDDSSSAMTSMTIRILPTRTRHVVLAASYTHVNEEKKKANADKKEDGRHDDDSIESHVYKSRPLQLDVVANRSTKVNVAAA